MNLILQAIKSLLRKVENSIESVRNALPTKLSDLENDLWYKKRELFLSLKKSDFEWDENGNGYYYTDKQDWFTGSDKIGFDWASYYTDDEGNLKRGYYGTHEFDGGLNDDFDSEWCSGYGCWSEYWYIGIYNGATVDADGTWMPSDKLLVYLYAWNDYCAELDLKIYHLDEKKVSIEYCDTSEVEAEIDALAEEVWNL